MQAPELEGQDRVEDRVEQVLSRAAKLFTEKGYGPASMRDLAAEVEIRPSSLYHHFPSKQHILAAICYNFQRDFNLEVVPELRSEQPPDAAIKAAIRRHILFSNRRWPDVLVNIRERRSLPREQQVTINALRRQYRDALMATIERGRAEGRFTVPDAKLAAMIILDMVNGVAHWFRPRDRRELERLAERYGDAAIGLLSAWKE
ncbi:MAG: TetR family transcriptional regulator [Candidatus Dormibacteraeota bacterium]|nr:TetR family transcriptional regulator [Candidatus Dormibacteraeota bacterium]